MSKMKVIKTIISVLLTTPLWFYLIYKILILVEATELMWFLFWIYIPASLIVITLSFLIEEK